ncbi:MAG: hypothetical protein ACYSWU_09375 [Planctomycetota bacterium]|jgi:hypothetical protein
MPRSDAKSDESEALVDLSGDWQGCYMQSGAARRISAVIVQTGERITGTMQDWETESERSLFDVALEAGLPPWADEQIDAQLRRLHPAEGKSPIRSKSRLPSESVLEGTVRGGFVTFTKTYHGQHFSGYQIGGQEVGWTAENHAVRYSGRIEGDGNRIEGVWTISDPDSPQKTIQGPFWLERVQKAGQRG